MVALATSSQSSSAERAGVGFESPPPLVRQRGRLERAGRMPWRSGLRAVELPDRLGVDSLEAMRWGVKRARLEQPPS